MAIAPTPGSPGTAGAWLPLSFTALLAQAKAANPTVQVLLNAGIICAGVIVLVLIAMLMRRSLLKKDEPVVKDDGFTLGDLRDLHNRGEIDDSEFERAKQVVITRSMARLNEPVEDDATLDAKAIDAAMRERGQADNDET